MLISLSKFNHRAEQASTGIRLAFLISLFVAVSLWLAGAPSVFANGYKGLYIYLKDESLNPITTAQDFRASLWDSYDTMSGDVDGSGNINTGATHYGGYQTTFIATPSATGFYFLSTKNLASFPNPIGMNNPFLMLEYKDQGAANTTYKEYDFLDDPPWNNMTRYLLVDNVSYFTFDAGSRTNYNSFTLDANSNAAGDIELIFGELLDKSLAYDTINSWFIFNNRLRIDGDLYIPDGNYAQFEDNNAGAPPANDCDADNERGRISIDTTNNRLYVCNGAARGWDYSALTD